MERARSRDRRLVIERNNAENRKQFDVPELVRFSEHLETGQFVNAFKIFKKYSIYIYFLDGIFLSMGENLLKDQ